MLDGQVQSLADAPTASIQFPVTRITGMFLWNGRLYYTLSGDAHLLYRWFTPESGVIGADTFVASGTTDGRNWSSVSGMTMASGRLIYGTTTGTLSAVDFTAGVPTRPPASSAPGFGTPEACCSSTSPPDPSRHRPAPPRCGPDPFRYPAPHPPL